MPSPASQELTMEVTSPAQHCLKNASNSPTSYYLNLCPDSS